MEILCCDSLLNALSCSAFSCLLHVQDFNQLPAIFHRLPNEAFDFLFGLRYIAIDAYKCMERSCQPRSSIESMMTSNTPKSNVSRACRCLCGSTIICLVLAGLAIFLAIRFTDSDSPGDVLPDDWEDLFDGENTFNATGPEDAPRWQNDGNGLSLQIIQALDERWMPYFERSVRQWDTGKPSVLDLFSVPVAQSSEVSSSCGPVEGSLKVCNGDYGETGWNGINELLLLDERIIIASTAKMNDYYLADASDNRKQYTMCKICSESSRIGVFIGNI